MPKTRLFIASLLVIVSMLLAACAPTTPAASPTNPPQPTTKPADTAAPANTEAPKPTEPPQPTAVPTTAAPATGNVTGEVTLWHSYHTGGAEEQAINQIVDNARKAFPDAKINVLAIPFDQIFNKWETEVAAGGGPDMFIAPNDNLGKEVRASLLAPVDQYTAGKLGDLAKVAIDGMTVDGKLYAVPESLKAVALYYNKDKVKTPPTTTEELLNLVKGGNVLVLNQNAYHNYGFWQAFGGVIADPTTGKCTAADKGFVDALQYLVDLKAAGAQFETDGGKADTMFRQGQADMIINGPWVLGDYQKDLGDKLGVVPMPAGPAGPAGPLTGVDGFYINPNSQNIESAVNLALYITNQEGQQIFVDVAGHSPSNTKVTISNPVTKAFYDAAFAGVPRPQASWFDNYWGPFGDVITKVLEGTVKPADGVTQACKDMDAANKITP